VNETRLVDTPAKASARAPRRRRWIAAGAALAVALYALAGFFLAPRLLARELVEVARSALGRPLEVGRVAINPFALSVDLEGVRLREEDGSELARVDELYVNFEASSLFRRAFTFSEIRIRGPWVHVARDAQGALNLARLARASPEPKAPAPPDGAALPRLLVQRFQLADGAFDFDDHSVATPFHTHAGPFALAVDEISTLPDATGQ
jgi:uncharacterized protein involved in outer membrane biogenesis